MITVTVNRSLSEIAREIKREWKNVSIDAQPYLDAMRSINSIDDHYGFETGKGIVMYFLCNAKSWRGDSARRIKAELKQML